jgi:hypothetical protein
MTGGSFDIQNVAFFYRRSEIVGSDAMRQIRPIRGSFLPFYGNAVIVRAVGTIGKRIATNQRLVAPGNIELKRQILAGLERGKGLAVVSFEVEGADVFAFICFFRHGEFAVAVPVRFDLLGFLAAQFDFADLETRLFESQALLASITPEADAGSNEFDGSLQKQCRGEDQPDGQAEISP